MKKTVVNRRMFRQGGAVNSGPAGILASSPSLIDAVAQDAMNVQGGPTVRMAEGGIVRMANGGMAARQRLIGTRTPQIILGTGSSMSPPDLQPSAIGILPAEQLFLETDPERTKRILPEMLRAGQAGMSVTTPAGETTSPMERALYKLGRFVSPVRDLAQRVAGAADVATQKQSPSLTDDDLYFFGLLEKTQPGANQSKIIRDMIERRPDLQTEIMSLSKQAVASSPDIGRDDLMNVVAKGLDAEALDKADRAMLEGYGLDPDAMVQPPGYSRAYKQSIFSELEEESDEYPGGREDFIDQEFAKDVDLGIVPSDPGQDDTLGEEDIQDPNIASEASQDDFTDSTGDERRAEAQGQDADTSFLAGVTPPRKPNVENPDIAGGSQNEIEALGTPANAKEAQEQVAKTFDKQGMKPEEAKRGMEYYLDQFKGAVPEYEGMSESEKGMIIAEAGLRVMAGQSPHAIENIAKGLQGVSKEFIADKKARRAYNRQIGLSAAKYALEAVSKDLALEEQDKRTLSYYYDVSKKDKDSPYGKLVAVSRAEILANNGQLPANLKTETLVKAEIAATAKAGATLKKALIENAKDYKIGRVEANEIKEEIDQSIKNLESSEAGIGLLAGVKAKLAAGDVTGFKNAAQELVRRGFAAINKGHVLDQKYSSLAQAQADVKQAFQALIPVSLGGVQSANSISNRDVQFLADAYIDSGFLTGGIFNMTFVDDRALASRLDGAIQKFRDGEKKAISSLQSIETRLSGSEANLAAAQAAGLPVGRGPFNRGYFAPKLEVARPLMQRAQRASAGRKDSGRAIAKIEGFTWDGSKYVVEGTN